MAAVAHTRVKTHSALSFHVVRGPERGRTPFLLLPAYADSWWSYSRVLPRLADELDVIALDPRGHGDSDRPRCCYRVEDFAGDIVDVLDALEIRRAVLVGHSGSCLAAREVARVHQRRVAGLVLIASPLRLDLDRLTPFIDRVRTLSDPVPEAFIHDFQAGTVHVPLPRPFIDGIVAESAKLPARVWRDTVEGLVTFQDEDALGAIKAHTTLVWGDRDAIVSRGDQERLRDGLPGAELVVLAETGHSPHWERPEAVVEVLLGLSRQIRERDDPGQPASGTTLP